MLSTRTRMGRPEGKLLFSFIIYLLFPSLHKLKIESRDVGVNKVVKKEVKYSLGRRSNLNLNFPIKMKLCAVQGFTRMSTI